jgi:hypothetical protein
MEQARLFSADSHVNEPPEAWERIPKELRARGPHFVQDPPGLKGQVAAQSGFRFGARLQLGEAGNSRTSRTGYPFSFWSGTGAFPAASDCAR